MMLATATTRQDEKTHKTTDKQTRKKIPKKMEGRFPLLDWVFPRQVFRDRCDLCEILALHDNLSAIAINGRQVTSNGL